MILSPFLKIKEKNENRDEDRNIVTVQAGVGEEGVWGVLGGV